MFVQIVVCLAQLYLSVVWPRVLAAKLEITKTGLARDFMMVVLKA
jgi:hypothetical protein